MTRRKRKTLLSRMVTDLRHLRNIDAYALVLVTLVFAVLSVASDVLPVNARWAVLLAGVALLVFRITLPERVPGLVGEVLQNRLAFEETPFTARLRGASELWVFAPTGVNLLSPQTCETIRSTLLSSPDGVVRVVVLDPAKETTVRQATRQLDDPLDSPPQLFLDSLRGTIGQLERIASAGGIRGSFGYRLLDANPGFSLVAIDPAARDGQVIVEFHGYHSETTASRMHIELNRASDGPWYMYWLDQFDRIWRDAREPGRPATETTVSSPNHHRQNPGQSREWGS